jgi:nucleoporin GLE1
MKTVKTDKKLKSAWSVVRRQITPKIGQLTNDSQSINHISHQLHALLVTNPPHPEAIYISLLSSLSKAILLQAETEVTASKEAAGQLAQVAANLLGALPHFSDIFYAKLVQRAGGWAVPTTIPSTDIDVDYVTRATKPIEFTQATRDKAMGYRLMDGGARETQGEYIVRVAGIMRVYFLVLVRATVDAPLERMWQTPRYWAYFARMMGGAVDIAEVGSAVAPEVLYGACFGFQFTYVLLFSFLVAH